MLEFRDSGKLYPLSDVDLNELFCGSIDRYCVIADRLSDKHRVLDCGAGSGMLCAILRFLGHEVVALDLYHGALIDMHQIDFIECNLEHDPFPFSDNEFDAVMCCQALEHFTHAHLPVVREMFRVIKPGGLIQVDVPNAVCFRNRSRMLRGKHITWDYEKHYLDTKPVLYKDREFYPDRHNREFTRDELALLLNKAGFTDVDVQFIKSRRYRSGLQSILSVGSEIKDAIPSLRKTLMAFGQKPESNQHEDN